MKHTFSRLAFAVAAASVLGLTSCTKSKGAAPTAPLASNPAAVSVIKSPPVSPGKPVVVSVVKTANGFQLMRGGKPYFIKGGGGSGSLQLLRDSGGNSVRTWGADHLGPTLAQAQKLGMTVTVGIWLGHKDQGFDYHNAAAVAAQYQTVRQDILRYRNSPALLMWGLGNEMEVGDEDDVAMWNAIEAIAKMAHQLDPHHPTMTVVAEIGGDKVAEINKYCPDIDIIGINSYGGAPTVATRYKAAGGVKPFVLTEFGPAGVWELPKNAWGAVPELTSTQKAAVYRVDYEKTIAHQPLCLGSYAFTWGYKQEATATWFGMLLPDGSRLAPVDAMTQMWTGKPPAVPCPAINRLAVNGPDQVPPGTTVHAVLNTSDARHLPLTVKWVLQTDPEVHPNGGAAEATPPAFPEAIKVGTLTYATVQMPSATGPYRLYAYVEDGHGGAAVGNIPLLVTSASATATAPGQKATLPLVLYGTGAASTPPYIPAGYMGDTGAIKMDPNYPTDPHSGTTSLQVAYSAADQWGGVVWQSPAGNWGTLPGGWNLTGAKALTFWARGAQGGEAVTFKYGLLGASAAYPDTATGTTGTVTLTPNWKQYTISLQGQNLSSIKTGFCWVVAGQGHPVTFYLDDIRYE